jgi:hypothetical protein
MALTLLVFESCLHVGELRGQRIERLVDLCNLLLLGFDLGAVLLLRSRHLVLDSAVVLLPFVVCSRLDVGNHILVRLSAVSTGAWPLNSLGKFALMFERLDAVLEFRNHFLQTLHLLGVSDLVLPVRLAQPFATHESTLHRCTPSPPPLVIFGPIAVDSRRYRRGRTWRPCRRWRYHARAADTAAVRLVGVGVVGRRMAVVAAGTGTELSRATPALRQWPPPKRHVRARRIIAAALLKLVGRIGQLLYAWRERAFRRGRNSRGKHVG